jgi:hypothetical protein
LNLSLLVYYKSFITATHDTIRGTTNHHRTHVYICMYVFFLIGIVGGGVQLGPLGTAATNRLIVPAPGDYDDGEIGGMIGREGKPKYSEKTCPSATLCIRGGPQNPALAP